MGYTIRIGNAVPYAEEDYFDWRVETVTNQEAPEFGDTAYKNERSPGYSVWAEFGRETGLTDVLKELMPAHPGIAHLKPHHLERVKAAIVHRKSQLVKSLDSGITIQKLTKRLITVKTRN